MTTTFGILWAMAGELYTELYIQRGARLPDDDRARFRIGVLFRDEDHCDYVKDEIAHAIERRLGVEVRWNQAGPMLETFVQHCALRDLLDTITIVHRVLQEGVDSDDADWWRESVSRIFVEQHLAYHVDEQGTVHPAVDQEFQQNRVSALAALSSSRRYANARTSFERISTELLSSPPNYKEAWRATFATAEGLFKLMFPRAPRLAADQVTQWLRPVVEGLYRSDQTALRATLRQADAFSEWVDASHHYRHEAGTVEPNQPPSDLAILSISLGASFIRWLVGIDAETMAS